MWYLLKKYQDSILLVLTLLFITGVIIAYVIGIRLIADRVDQTINSKTDPQNTTRFNISEAEKLNYKGLQLPQ